MRPKKKSKKTRYTFSHLRDLALEKKLAGERIDVTLPGRGEILGQAHPLTQVRERIENILKSMGFKVADGQK